MAPKSNDRSKDKEPEASLVPEPLDGGYGWVIVVAAFVIHILVDGASFGYGVVSKHIKDYYGVSESEATLVGSLQLGFYLLSCPFAGKMVEKLGFRITCFVGTLLATTGFVLAQFSPNIIVMMITYGVIAGTGFGLMYLSSISAVTLYFDKKRVLATGLATSGSGLGMFAFSGICGSLIEVYDWKNALLIMAGIILNGCVVAMLLRPLSAFQKGTSKKIKYSAKDGGEVTASLLDVQNGDKQLDDKPKSKKIRRSDESGFESDDSGNKDSPKHKQKKAESVIVNGVEKSSETIQSEKEMAIQSLHDIGESLTNVDDKAKKHREIEDLEFKAAQAEKKTAKQKARAILNEIIDMKMMKEPIFHIICVANVFTFLGVVIPLKFQVDRAMTFPIGATQKEIQDRADFLVSVSGIANTVGRAMSSVLDLNKNINKALVHNIAVLFMGVICFFTYFCTNYALMCAFASVFTFSLGIYIALSSVVVCELLGPVAVNNAFALMCMLRGFANIAGSPIAGAAYDKLQNYDVCFYIGGSMMVLGGICFCMLLLPRIQRRSFKNRLREAEEEIAASGITLDDNVMIASVMNVFNAPDPGTPRMLRTNIALRDATIASNLSLA